MIIKKKIYKEYFDEVVSGKKKFELRPADFEVKKGDTLILEEWDKQKKKYTGRKVEAIVTYVLKTKKTAFWTDEEIKKYVFKLFR